MGDKFFYTIIILGLIYFFFQNFIRSNKTDKMIINGAQVIDVRNSEEFYSGHFKGSINIPLHEIEKNIKKIKSINKDIIVVCASGMRSRRANQLLNNMGINSINGGSWTNLK